MARGDSVSVRAMKLAAALLTRTSSGAFAQIFDIIWSIASASRTSQPCVSTLPPVACTQFGGRGIEHLGASPADDDVCAELQVATGDALAQAGAAAGHEDALALQQVGTKHRSLSLPLWRLAQVFCSRPSSMFAMMLRWIWFVPSMICTTLASRK